MHMNYTVLLGPAPVISTPDTCWEWTRGLGAGWKVSRAGSAAQVKRAADSKDCFRPRKQPHPDSQES